MPQRYSMGAIVLHWLIAIALAFQLAVGFGLEHLGPSGFGLYQLHKSVGLTILFLSLLRLGWRLFVPRPAALEHGWQGFLAHAVHVGLYVFMIGGPLTGWLLVSTEKVKVPTLIFGTIPWPRLPLPDSINGLAHVSHAMLAFIGIGLFLLHVAGAVRHQWMIRDNLIARMAPGGSIGAALVLMVLIPLGWFAGTMALGGAGAPPPAAEPANAANDMGALANDVTNAAGNVANAVDVAANAVAAAANAIDPDKAGPPPVWTIAPGGKLGFSVDNGGLAVNGEFAKWSGDIAMDPDAPESATIAIKVDLASASVGDPTQDGMLVGDEFFNVPAHPSATWRSSGVRKTGANSYSASGTLSLKGVSKPQSIRFTLSGSGLSRHVEGKATIDRKAFAIGTGASGESLAPQVTLSFSFDAKGKAAPK